MVSKTTIQISKKNKILMNKLKMIEREPYDEVLTRILRTKPKMLNKKRWMLDKKRWI